MHDRDFGLDSEAAKINLPDSTHEVSINSISRLWYGEYLVLWRPQVQSPRALSAGMQGAGVRWLRTSLNSVQGLPNDANASDYYDEELVRMVEDFQRRHRLSVDGIAGVQTQIVGGARAFAAQLLEDALDPVAEAFEPPGTSPPRADRRRSR